MGESEGAKAVSIVCVRLAGLGGGAAGPASVPLSSEDGGFGYRAAQGCGRRRQCSKRDYARFAGLGGCAAGPAVGVLLSSEAGSAGLRAAHGGSRRCGGGKSQSVRDLLALVAVLLARTHARRVSS